MAAAGKIITLDNVSKLFGLGDAATLALDEVKMTIKENEFVAVMGPSGSGKSTLMNIIGLLDRPTHGSYYLGRRKVATLGSDERAKIRRDRIGFIFQSYNLLSRLSVLENVALPLAYKGIPLAKREKLASKMLERVGMSDREYFYPPQLSGGQVQCVAIARALVNTPELIIADESTGNLDSSGSRLIMELLSEIHRGGNTILFVTHNPELTRYADRVVFMHDGQIIRDVPSKPGEVASEALKAMYAIPATSAEDDLAGISALMEAVPQRDTNSRSRGQKKSKASKSPKRKTTNTKKSKTSGSRR
jgi:putative ABC transport system ATP-binding protein